MEDDLKLFCNWKTTSSDFVNERHLYVFCPGGRPGLILKIEDDLNIFCKWKKTLINFENGNRPQTI